jgi:Fic family protein
MKYVWDSRAWPALNWKSEALLPLISRARMGKGKLAAEIANLGFDLSREAQAEILIEETVKTSAIEGEALSRESVRSSVARRLGLPTAGLKVPASHAVDGLVEVLMDATKNYTAPLSAERLKQWQAALFPTGYSGLTKIRVGVWRSSGHPMRVVSGALGKEKVHFEAPPGENVENEMRRFFLWWKESEGREDGLLRSALAHFYFVTIHPFEDGNGRLARVLADMALAQDEKLSTRCYSLSSQIMEDRDEYYEVLERCQKGSGEVTEWLQWFLGCHVRAVEGADKLIGSVLAKARFWHYHSKTQMNERQRKVLNRLLDAGKGGFEGFLTSRKYVALTKASRATAYREITELLKCGVLIQTPAKGGRSVSYDVNWDLFEKT